MVTTAIDIVNHFEVGPSHVQFGLIPYNDFISPRAIFLTDSLDKQTFIQKLADLVNFHPGGGTRTDKALKFLHKNMTQSANRTDIPKIGILFTDGKSNKPLYTAIEADIVKDKNISMAAVGIGPKILKAELKKIASTESQVILTNFSALPSIVNELTLTICDRKYKHY